MESVFFYLGIDLNDQSAMISCFQPGMKEPETVSTVAGGESFRIPTMLAKRKDREQWFFGSEAGKMAKNNEVVFVDSLLQRAMGGEQLVIGDDVYTGGQLLAAFLKKLMSLPKKPGGITVCSRLVITVDRISEKMMKLFWDILPDLGVSREQFKLIDHKTAFYYFALSQPEALRLHDLFLFDYARNAVRPMELSRDTKTRPQTVTVLEGARMAVRGDRDKAFFEILQQNLENRIVSTIYLVGDGFDGGWMKTSLSYLCRGRRVFLGKNLYTKGACYCASVSDMPEGRWPYIFMGDDDMKFNLSIKVKTKGKSAFHTLVAAGRNWFEINENCEVILEGPPEIDLWKQLPNSRDAKVETLELTDFPKREDRTTRIRITARPISDNKIDITVTDLGFGEICRSSGKSWGYTISM